MSDPLKPARRANGKYAKGSSGNPKGRPKKKRERIVHPEAWRDMAADAGEFLVPISINGVDYHLPLLQANFITLGIRGANGHAISARHFLTQHRAAVQQEIDDNRIDRAQLLRGRPSYLDVEDPAKRKAAYDSWKYALDAASGRRERNESALRRQVREHQKKKKRADRAAAARAVDVQKGDDE